tara:strand:+ start:732 stop:869 length:138 start_codon:yes stop_codon:yes gene_type:complete
MIVAEIGLKHRGDEKFAEKLIKKLTLINTVIFTIIFGKIAKLPIN